MGKIDKLINKTKDIPNDLRYDELKKILESLGYEENCKGKTSGSRVIFYRESDGDKILGHKPHGSDCVSVGWIRCIVKHLEDKGDI